GTGGVAWGGLPERADGRAKPMAETGPKPTKLISGPQSSGRLRSPSFNAGARRQASSHAATAWDTSAPAAVQSWLRQLTTRRGHISPNLKANTFKTVRENTAFSRRALRSSTVFRSLEWSALASNRETSWRRVRISFWSDASPTKGPRSFCAFGKSLSRANTTGVVPMLVLT